MRFFCHSHRCAVISKEVAFEMKRGSRRRPSEPDEWSSGSIIVRRLICLLYTAGGLLSGIPFYGTPTVYVVPASCVREGGGEGPLANATHVVTSRRPLSSRRNPGAPLRRDGFGWWEMSTETWGVLIAHHLTLRGQDLALTACGLRHPAAGSRVNTLFWHLLVFCGLTASPTELSKMNMLHTQWISDIFRVCVSSNQWKHT